MKKTMRSTLEKREHVIQYEQALNRTKYLKKHKLTRQKISSFRTALKYSKTDTDNRCILLRIQKEREEYLIKKLKKKQKKKKKKIIISSK